MKKLSLFYLIPILFFCYKNTAAQIDSGAVATQIVRTSDDLKTGNYTDVLTSAFQVALTDLTSESRSFDFKSTLFAFKVKANPDLKIDRNYIKQKFARSLQFNLSVGINQDYKLDHYSFGFTYAIINKRDRTVANFMHTAIDTILKVYHKTLLDAIDAYTQSDTSSLFLEHITLLNAALNAYEKTGTLEFFPPEFLSILRLDLTSFRNNLQRMLKEQYDKVDQQPLLTISGNAVSDSTSSVFDSGYLEAVFLYGGNPETDLRAKLYIKDTLFIKNQTRSTFNFKGSINFVLASEKVSKKSLIEGKAQGEFNQVLTGLLPGEDRQQFMVNAEIRLRIKNDLWIPLILKYDFENSNLFGFINVALNLDALRNTKF